MFCSKCGQQNPESGLFCIRCGHSLQGLPTDPQTQPVPASPVISGSLLSLELSPLSQAADPSPKPNKKSRAGLFVGLVAGGLVLITVFLAFFLGVIPMLNRESRNRVAEAAASASEESASEALIVGFWTNSDQGIVMEFKEARENGSNFVYYKSGKTYEGSYEYDATDKTGFVSYNYREESFQVLENTLAWVPYPEGVFIKVTDKNFDVQAWLDDNQGVTAPTTAETTSSVDLYAKAMEKYVIMDPVTFDALPRLDRLQYSKYLVDKTIGNGEYDSMYSVNSVHKRLRLKYTEVSKDNTGQEIIDNYTLTFQIAYLQTMNNNSAKIDPVKLEEVLTLNYYEVGSNDKILSNSYLDVKNFADTLTKPVVAANINTVTDTSELMEGIDNEGNKVSYKIVTWHEQTDNIDIYSRFFYCEYKSYDGSDKAVWLLDTQEGSPLLD